MDKSWLEGEGCSTRPLSLGSECHNQMQFSRITFSFFISRSDATLDLCGCLFRIDLCMTKYSLVAIVFNTKVKSYERCWMKSVERMPAGCLWCKLHFASWGLYVPSSIAVFDSSVTFLHLMKTWLIIFLQYSLYWPQTCFPISYPFFLAFCSRGTIDHLFLLFLYIISKSSLNEWMREHQFMNTKIIHSL